MFSRSALYMVGSGLLVGGLLLGGSLLGSSYFARKSLNEPVPLEAVLAVAIASPALAGAPPATRERNGTTSAVAASRSGVLYAATPGEQAEGTVWVVSAAGSGIVRFENVVLPRSFDAEVYLNPAGSGFEPARALRVGTLRAVTGSFNYKLSGVVDAGSFGQLVVWSPLFHRVLASAVLH